jgi:hypothetical protein
MLPSPISLQRFQTITGRNPKIIQSSCPVQKPKASQSDPSDRSPAARRFAVEQLLRVAVAE